MGVPATGRRVSVHGTIHSRVEGGRLVEEWELLDLATLYQQLGLADDH
jgi:predicted ester cyclase